MYVDDEFSLGVLLTSHSINSLVNDSANPLAAIVETRDFIFLSL